MQRETPRQLQKQIPSLCYEMTSPGGGCSWEGLVGEGFEDEKVVLAVALGEVVLG